MEAQVSTPLAGPASRKDRNQRFEEAGMALGRREWPRPEGVGPVRELRGWRLEMD